jgi:hypothetical protein
MTGRVKRSLHYGRVYDSRDGDMRNSKFFLLILLAILQKVKALLVGMDLQMSVIFSQLGASQPWEKKKETIISEKCLE